MKEFAYLEEHDEFPRKILVNLRHVTALHVSKCKDGLDRLKIYLNPAPQPYEIVGKDAQRIFDEIKIHLSREGLL